MDSDFTLKTHWRYARRFSSRAFCFRCRTSWLGVVGRRRGPVGRVLSAAGRPAARCERIRGRIRL